MAVEQSTGPLLFSMMHPAGNNATNVTEPHSGPLPFSTMHPAHHISSLDEYFWIVVPLTRNGTNGTIPFGPPTPLLFNETGIPVNLTELVHSNRTGLAYPFAPHNHTFGSNLPALNGISTQTITVTQQAVTEQPSAISQGGTVLSLVLIAILMIVLILAYVRSLFKKSNVWPFKKKRQMDVEEVVEVGRVDNSVF